MAKTYHLKMHSAEHILNAAMDRKFGCGRCFNAHIDKKKSKCDYRFDRNLTDSEIQEIEAKVNQVIQQDLEITGEHLSRDEAQKKYDMKKVPDHAEEIRVVKVGDYDYCPCIGEHVDSTGEIGLFKITTTGYDDGTLRIRFKLPG